MSTRSKWQLILLAGIALLAQTARGAQQTDRLRDLAKQAKAKGDLDQEANDLCEAATMDHSHYQKRCERARADAQKEMQLYEGYFLTGKFELQQKNFAGGIRDLGRINFGPHRDEAQSLILQAKAALIEASPANAGQSLLMQSAQAAYDRGDFDTAGAQASQVQAASQQGAAKQLLTNIKVYQDTMMQAEVLARNGDYKGAQEKYSFAIKIKANGPGLPAEKLQQVEAKIQESAATPQSGLDSAKPQSLSPPKVDNAVKVKSGLAAARRYEAKGDIRAALREFAAVLALDGSQAEALAGKQRMTAKLKGDPKALAESLEDGIRSYYASQFAEAEASISLYLSAGGLQNKGAAHFYLAASFLSQALFTDPHDDAHIRSLQQSADEQFQMARQEKYVPVEKLVSPRILAAWTRNGSRQ